MALPALAARRRRSSILLGGTTALAPRRGLDRDGERLRRVRRRRLGVPRRPRRSHHAERLVPSTSACAATRRATLTTAWTWLAAGHFSVRLQLLVDPLSTLMMLIVSGVGGLIVLYSIGYMDGDPEERRYFAYIAFFVFSMLLLVEGGNLLMLLVGWGLVGLSSYLLIGFWHERPSAVRRGEEGVRDERVRRRDDGARPLHPHRAHALALVRRALDAPYSVDRGDLVALGLLGGAVAKSAQIPLQTWLPDAMEGPTPVSALIHAATMVTAGVYLIARTHVDLRAGADGRADRRRHRRADVARRGADRARPDRHQARHRVLDDVADRLHVPRRRGRGVLERDVPPHDARLLQGDCSS